MDGGEESGEGGVLEKPIYNKQVVTCTSLFFRRMIEWYTSENTKENNERWKLLYIF